MKKALLSLILAWSAAGTAAVDPLRPTLILVDAEGKEIRTILPGEIDVTDVIEFGTDGRPDNYKIKRGAGPQAEQIPGFTVPVYSFAMNHERFKDELFNRFSAQHEPAAEWDLLGTDDSSITQAQLWSIRLHLDEKRIVRQVEGAFRYPRFFIDEYPENPEFIQNQNWNVTEYFLLNSHTAPYGQVRTDTTFHYGAQKALSFSRETLRLWADEDMCYLRRVGREPYQHLQRQGEQSSGKKKTLQKASEDAAQGWTVRVGKKSRPAHFQGLFLVPPKQGTSIAVAVMRLSYSREKGGPTVVSDFPLSEDALEYGVFTEDKGVPTTELSWELINAPPATNPAMLRRRLLEASEENARELAQLKTLVDVQLVRLLEGDPAQVARINGRLKRDSNKIKQLTKNAAILDQAVQKLAQGGSMSEVTQFLEKAIKSKSCKEALARHGVASSLRASQ